MSSDETDIITGTTRDSTALTWESRAIWNAKAAFWDERMGAEGNAFQRLLVGPATERLLALRAGEVVLDVACSNDVMVRGRPTKLRDLLKPDDTAIRSKLLARCVGEGDEQVIEEVDDAADYLGAGLGSLASFYNPPQVILGGGLIESVLLFFERAALRAHEVSLPLPGRRIELVRTALGDNAGIVASVPRGGARIARELKARHRRQLRQEC